MPQQDAAPLPLLVDCQACSCSLQVTVPASHRCQGGNMRVRCGGCSRVLRVQLPSEALLPQLPLTINPQAYSLPPPAPQQAPTRQPHRGAKRPRREPSAYNTWISAEILRLRAAHPDLDHQAAWRLAAGSWVTLGAKAVTEQAQQVWQQETARRVSPVQQLQPLGTAAPDAAGTQRQQDAAAPWAGHNAPVSAAPAPAHGTAAGGGGTQQSMAPPPDRVAPSSSCSLPLSDAANNARQGDSSSATTTTTSGMTLQQTWDELCRRHDVAAAGGNAQPGGSQ